MRLIAVTLIAGAFALNACAPVVVGAAAAGVAGGYYIGEDERSPTQIAKDATTTGQVKTLFFRDEIVRAGDINVDTNEGNVLLKGHVENAEQLTRAEELAWSIGGVKSVTNHLAVIP